MNAAYKNRLSNERSEEDKNKMTPSDQSRSHPSGDPSLDSAKEYSTQQPAEIKGSSDSNQGSSNSDKEMGDKQ